MTEQLDKEITDTLRALDIDREERPDMAQIIGEVAEHFYKLGRRDLKQH